MCWTSWRISSVSDWSPLTRRLTLLQEARSPADAWILFRAATIACLIPLLMRLPLERLWRLIEPGSQVSPIDVKQERHLLDLVDSALALIKPVARIDCLARGVTRYYELRRAGVEVVLAFGVAQTTRGAIGHCWLVRNGVPYLELQDPRPIFVETYRFAPLLRHRPAC